jgi:hypothetical protein
MGKKVWEEVAWEVSAPLGELPDEQAIKLLAEAASERDRRYRTYTLGSQVFSFVKDLLEEVRGREGIHVSRSVYPRGLVSPLSWSTISVLTAVGVHGRESAYALHYARARADESGRPPFGPFWVRTRVAHLRQIRAQLEVLQKGLFERYPALRGVSLRGLSAPPVFVEVVERGEVAFAVSANGRATHVLVGKNAVFPLRRPHDGEGLLQATDEALVKVLRKSTALGALPPRTVLGLLRGGGDRRAVERVLAMARLGTL